MRLQDAAEERGGDWPEPQLSSSCLCAGATAACPKDWCSSHTNTVFMQFAVPVVLVPVLPVLVLLVPLPRGPWSLYYPVVLLLVVLASTTTVILLTYVTARLAGCGCCGLR
jgi:hypothetical protein